MPVVTRGTAQKMKLSFKDCVSKCEHNYIISSNMCTASISPNTCLRRLFNLEGLKFGAYSKGRLKEEGTYFKVR